MGTFEMRLNASCIMILLQVYEDWAVKGVSLNIICPHHFIESDTTRRYNFVGLGMALLEGGCHFRGGL